MQSRDTITLTGLTPSDGSAGELEVPRSLGSVDLVREIGRGGMGVVYLGRHRMLGRDVAVKFLLHAVPGSDDPGFVGFLEGARAAAQVEHPGLTTIHHADVVNNIPYLVMQHVDGPTLRDVMRVVGSLDSSVASAVLDAVLDAIGELHHREIVHRDIKPSNVLLSLDGRILVTDFGLTVSRPLGLRSSGPTLAGGSPAYMAPEMFAGDASLRSDVYALGVMAYELFSGELPFSGTLDEMREQHLREVPALGLLRQRGVETSLIDVIERALHKDVMFRYKTAHHLRNALRPAILTPEHVRKGVLELRALILRTLDVEPDEPGAAGADATPPTTYFDRLSEIASERRTTRDVSAVSDPGDLARDDQAGSSAVLLPEQAAEAKPPADTPPEERGVGAGLRVDVLCAQCKYNLRGLPEGGRCPECGEPMSSSLDPRRLIFAPRAALARNIRGLTWLWVTMLAAPLIPSLFPALVLVTPADPDAASALFFIIAGLLDIMCLAFGAVCCSTPLEPQVPPRGSSWTSRRTTRILAMFWLFASSSALVVEIVYRIVVAGEPPGLLGRVAHALRGVPLSICIVFAIVALFGMAVGVLLHLATLAERIPDPRLVRRARRIAVFLAICVMIFASLFYLGSVHRIGLPESRDGHSVMLFVAELAVLGGLTALLLGWETLRLCRRALKRALAESVSHDALFSDTATTHREARPTG